MATPPQLSDADREELRLLYQVTVSDIAFFKQQQWSISNYALTVEAAFGHGVAPNVDCRKKATPCECGCSVTDRKTTISYAQLASQFVNCDVGIGLLI